MGITFGGYIVDVSLVLLAIKCSALFMEVDYSSSFPTRLVKRSSNFNHNMLTSPSKYILRKPTPIKLQ